MGGPCRRTPHGTWDRRHAGGPPSPARLTPRRLLIEVLPPASPDSKYQRDAQVLMLRSTHGLACASLLPPGEGARRADEGRRSHHGFGFSRDRSRSPTTLIRPCRPDPTSGVPPAPGGRREKRGTLLFEAAQHQNSRVGLIIQSRRRRRRRHDPKRRVVRQQGETGTICPAERLGTRPRRTSAYAETAASSSSSTSCSRPTPASRPLSRQAASPCWLRSRPRYSWSSGTRSGMTRSTSL